MVSKPGHVQLVNYRLTADGSEHVIVLPAVLTIRGVVKEHGTELPIKEFTWMPVSEFDGGAMIVAHSCNAVTTKLDS